LSCFKKVVKERPDAKELLLHPWLREDNRQSLNLSSQSEILQEYNLQRKSSIRGMKEQSIQLRRSRRSMTLIQQIESRNLKEVYIRATVGYQPKDQGELQFDKGDIIQVLEQDPSGIWIGRLDDRVGWISAQYFEIVYQRNQAQDEAINALKEDKVNQELQKQRNRATMERLQQVQHSFVKNDAMPEICVPGRIYIREGTFIKVGRKSKYKRTFFLFNDALLYAGNAANSKFVFHRIMALAGCKVQISPEIPDMKYCLQLKNRIKSFLILMESDEERQSWFQDLQKNIEEQTKKTSTPEYASVMEFMDNEEDFWAPIWMIDSETNQCMVCNRSFGMLKRRHHCRSCGKLVCGSCSSQKTYLPNISMDARVRVCLNCFKKIKSRRSGLEI